MKAIKNNKVYKVDDITKKSYLSQGYDIYNDDGKLLEKSLLSKVSYEQYSKLQSENDALKAEIEKLKSAKK